MRLIKIGLSSINTTVGDFTANVDKLIHFMSLMASEKCTLGCFQEQVISGYPVEDLIQWKGFVGGQKRQLERIVRLSGELSFPTVFTLGFTSQWEGNLYNVVAVVCDGVLVGVVPKEKLPTYNVFYEGRTFSRGIAGKVGTMEFAGKPVPFGDVIFRFPFGVVAVEVCEDIWSADGPMTRRVYSGAEIVVNASASPFRSGIADTRREMISTRAADNQSIVVYVNQYGGNDSLVFDGGGFINQNGRMLMEAPRWRQGYVSQVVDLDRTTRLRQENTTWRGDYEAFQERNKPVHSIGFERGPQADNSAYPYPWPVGKNFFFPNRCRIGNSVGPCPKPTPIEQYFDDLIEAMVTGLDYFVKTGAFKKIGISLSGGKDSLLSLIVAWLFATRRVEAATLSGGSLSIGDLLECFTMPSRYNSAETMNISRTICAELGVPLKEIPIEDSFEREIDAAKAMIGGADPQLTPLTLQNIQARIRGERMHNWCNTSGGMWLQTSNMSEKAVGYTTIGGDMMGAYSLTSNVPKSVIIRLLGHVYDRYGFRGVAMALESKASAELTVGQEDEKDLMPFDVLDSCIYLFVEEKLTPGEVYTVVRTMWSDDELRAMRDDYTEGMLHEWVSRFVRLFNCSIFKWVQSPQAVHVGKLELDRERALQIPVVQSMDWLVEGRVE
ncbi:MAG: NAD(+) synthase [Nitrospirae bacterium]|nr:NAD(+) synthase [Nitrospirota bacterium]